MDFDQPGSEGVLKPATGRRRLRRLSGGRSAACFLVALTVGVIPFVVAIPAAFAGVGLGIIPNFPSTVTVGQTNVHGSVTITNLSNGPEATGNVTLSQILLVPSCGTFSSTSQCPAAGADPGVFAMSATGVGRAGTSCDGTIFTVTTNTVTTGRVRFNPSTPVVLGPPGSGSATCVIDFTFTVVKAPTKDISVAPGTQTGQIASAVGTHDDGTPGSGTGSSTVTVNPAADTVLPSCNLSGSSPGQILITVQDAGSGLASVVATVSNNATVIVPAFTVGTNGAIVVTANKTTVGLSSQVELQVTDVAGNVTTCDPTALSISRSSGSVTQTTTGVAAGEHLLTVFNGRPGIRTLVVNANGHVFVVHLSDGQTAMIDLAGAFHAGTSNTVKITAGGGAGSTASVVLHD